MKIAMRKINQQSDCLCYRLSQASKEQDWAADTLLRICHSENGAASG